VDDLNDLYYFAMVVQHNGFSAAARATGLDKTRLSRRIAGLEARLGVRLLQRSTRRLTLTEAGARFYDHCQVLVEGARSAYDGVAELRSEPAGMVRVSCISLAQNYLASLLPDYLASHPKVRIVLVPRDSEVNLIEEHFDLAVRAVDRIEEREGLVARQLGVGRSLLVASPGYLRRHGRPPTPAALAEHVTIASTTESGADGEARWALVDDDGRMQLIHHRPQLIADAVQLEAAVHGIGIALLPEPLVEDELAAGRLQQALEGWSGTLRQVHLMYHSPRGMLPSVRSLIDYLCANFSKPGSGPG
jgi:DNA-binding transcriptional LysR family regulator